MKKIERYIYIVLIVILVGVIASGTTYMLMKDKEEKITLSEKELEEYLDYVPFLEASIEEDYVYADAYQGKKVSVNSIDKELLIYKAMLNSKEYIFNNDDEIPKYMDTELSSEAIILDEYYRIEDINANLKNMYNIDSININKLNIPSGFLGKIDSYYGVYHSYGSPNSFIKSNGKVTGYKENDNIIIEEEALFYVLMDYSEDPFELKIFANTSNLNNYKNAIKTISVNYDKIANLNLKNYGNFNFTKYKHTFKKNNTGYYWYSTEVVK